MKLRLQSRADSSGLICDIRPITANVGWQVQRSLSPSRTGQLGYIQLEYSTMTPGIDYDSRDNCEPYSPDFVHADFRGMLAQAGFVVADGPPTSNSFLQSIVATRA